MNIFLYFQIKWSERLSNLFRTWQSSHSQELCTASRHHSRKVVWFQTLLPGQVHRSDLPKLEHGSWWEFLPSRHPICRGYNPRTIRKGCAAKLATGITVDWGWIGDREDQLIAVIRQARLPRRWNCCQVLHVGRRLRNSRSTKLIINPSNTWVQSTGKET